MIKIITLIISLLSVVVNGSIFYYSSEPFYSMADTVAYWYGSPFTVGMNISGPVKVIDNPCVPYSGDDMIVLLKHSACGLTKQIDNAQNVVAVISTTGFTVPGSMYRVKMPSVPYPILDISIVLLNDLVTKSNITAIITPDYTVWEDIFNSPVYIFFQALAILISLSLVVLAFYALYLLFRKKKLKFSVGSTCLVIEILENSFRIIAWVDIMNSRFLYSDWLEYLFNDLGCMFPAISSILIGLYWLELIKINHVTQSFLIRYRYLFYSITATIIIIRLICLILFALSMINTMFSYMLTGIFIWIILFFSTALLGIAGRQMLQQLKGFNEQNKYVENRIRLLIILCFSSASSFLILAAVAAGIIYSQPVLGKMMFNWINYLLFICSYCKIFTFLLKKKKKSNTTNNSSQKNTNSSQKKSEL